MVSLVPPGWCVSRSRLRVFATTLVSLAEWGKKREEEVGRLPLFRRPEQCRPGDRINHVSRLAFWYRSSKLDPAVNC